MYNDEHNLYHYTYRKDGSENNASNSMDGGFSRFQTGTQEPPVVDMKPSRKGHIGVKFGALALCCALLGGAAGAGVSWGILGGDNSTSVNISGRPASSVAVKTVDGKTAMSDAEVYASNVNSVVSINASATTTNFFGQTVESASSGSGFILTQDGYIVTNHHVVADAVSMKVTLYNGDTFDGTYIGGDEDYDIAVIKIKTTGLQAVTLGNSETLNVGDHVLAVGNPLGELTFSMSGGMVSSVNRPINVDGTPFNMIQTDTSINPGNSGGPLFNVYGEVIGIVSAKYSNYSNSSVEGLGFAIPMNDVFAMIQDIMTNGYITNKPYLGVTAGTMNQQMAQQKGLTEGVYIYSVESGGPAEKAGLKVGDIIKKIDDKDITTMEDLTAVKKSYTAGSQANFTVYRQGSATTVKVTWGSVPADQQAQAAQPKQTQQQPQDNSNYGNGNMNDLFDYFFNNQYGGQGGQQSPGGNGTAA